jgi:single-strand DNA-binding protein
MANLNRVMLIGRLTRDPEMRTFSNGGRVAAFGFAVNNLRKDQETGQWRMDEPVFLDCKAFNRGNAEGGGGRKLADLVEKSLHKGSQVFIEGHLKMEEWTSNQDGQKRTKLVVYVDELQFLEPRQEGQGYNGGASKPAAAPGNKPASPAAGYDDGGGMDERPTFSNEGPNQEKDIPF